MQYLVLKLNVVYFSLLDDLPLHRNFRSLPRQTRLDILKKP